MLRLRETDDKFIFPLDALLTRRDNLARGNGGDYEAPPGDNSTSPPYAHTLTLTRLTGVISFGGA